MVRTYDTGCCGSTDHTAPSTILIVLAGSLDVRTTRNEYLSGFATCVSGTYTAGFISYSNPRSRMSRTTPAIVHHGFLVSSSLSPNLIRLPTALLPGQCRLAKNSLMTITRAPPGRSPAASNLPSSTSAPTVSRYSVLTSRYSASFIWPGSSFGSPSTTYPSVSPYVMNGASDANPTPFTPGNARASSATFRKNAQVFSLVSYFVLGIGTAIVSR